MPYFQKKDRGPYTNEYIRSEKILLLDEFGEKIWLFPKKEALVKAEEESKDLIQVWYNPKEWIATAKLMEIGKYLYLKKKEENEKKKAQKSKSLKEVKFSYNIGENDLQLKLDNAKEFLEQGHSVKIIGQLKWRENIYSNKLFERLKKIEIDFEDIWKSQWIKKEKKWYSVILFTKKK